MSFSNTIAVDSGSKVWVRLFWKSQYLTNCVEDMKTKFAEFKTIIFQQDTSKHRYSPDPASQSQKGLGIQTSVKLVCGNIVDEGQPLWGTYRRFQLWNLCYAQFILQCQECMRLLVSLIFCRGYGLQDWTKLQKSHHYWMLVLPTCTPSSTSKTGSADMYPSQYRLVALTPHQFSFPLPLLVFMAVSVSVVTLSSFASYCSHRATSTCSWEHGQMV